MIERPVVVISSTALDLPEHRGEVSAACLSLDCVPKMMEHLPAVDADAIQASIDLVDQADVYLGIFAYRYGYVPKNHEFSITEMELKRAEERQIPCLIFLIHESHPVTGKDVETGAGADKLEALKSRLMTERVVGFFSSPSDLRAKILHSLIAFRSQLEAEAEVAGEPATQSARGLDLPPPSIKDNPYRSLSAFEEKDASVFYGRDALIRETLAEFYALVDPSGGATVRLLAILGPSGSGKSSFARAGLAAHLNRKARDQQGGPQVFTFVPGEHPMAVLTQLIRAVCGGEAPALAEAAAHKAHDDDGQSPFPSPLTPLPAGGPKQLVLLVDQFEEVYSLGSDQLEQNAFVESLVMAASETKGRVSVIITMRSDFLGETQRHSKLNTAIARHSLIVPAMSAEELRLAITEPAKRLGHPIDEATVGRLIGETIGHEGVLPLLQFVLSAIWRGMVSEVTPEDTVSKLGGVGGALANHAEELFQALPAPDQQIARRAFLGMVHLGEGAQDTRRRVPVDRLVAGDSPQHVREVINQFADPDRRLVTLSEEAEQPIAEVTHEALFSHWKRLQQWLDEGRDDIRFQRRLAEAADEWKAQKQEDRDGFVWRPPLLSLLINYHQEHSGDMRPLDIEFFDAGKAKQQREEEEKKQRQEEKRLAEKRIADQELEAQETRTRFFRILTVVMSCITLLAVGAGGFFAFATVHGLDPGETVKALMIRSPFKDVPVPEMVTITPGKKILSEGKEVSFPESFQMGSNDGQADEQPVHRVEIETPFAIGIYEVTFDEYDAFVEATTGTNDPDDRGWGRDKRPVINVSWDDAQSYVKWLNAVTGKRYRLPTESEWEYVARACGEPESDCWSWKYWWGQDVQEGGQAWANCDGCNATWEGKDSGSNTATVDDEAFEPNAFGLYHTAGNVYEWVQDCWHDSYAGDPPKDGSAWPAADGANCGRRVFRGGSWYDAPRFVRSADRNWYLPDFRNGLIGFRLAQDID